MTKPKINYTFHGTNYGLKHDIGASIEFDDGCDDIEWVSAKTEEALKKKIKKLTGC